MLGLRYEYPFFTLHSPGDWLDITTPQLVLDVSGDLKPNVSFKLRPRVEEGPADLEIFVKVMLSMLRRDLVDKGLEIQGIENRQVDGRMAKAVTFSFLSNERRFRSLQVFFLDEDFETMITLTSGDAEFDEAIAPFETLLDGLVFRKRRGIVKGPDDSAQ